MSEKRGHVQRFIILSVMVISFSFAQKGALTMGFNLFLPRGVELTLGYYILENFAIQVDVGEFAPKKRYIWEDISTKRSPQFIGLSVIYKPFHEDMYFALGYKRSQLFGGVTEEDSIRFINRYYERLINFEVGYEINLYDKIWKSPVGFGTHIAFRKMLKKTEDPFGIYDLVNTIWDSLTVKEKMNYLDLYGEEIIKRHGKRIEKKENVDIVRPFRFYVSSGIIWYSKSANRN